MDIKQNKEVLDTINAIVNSGNIAEVKMEKKGLTVVEITRKVKIVSDVSKQS